MESIARRTPSFSGAQLANLLNEAAILTARRRKDAITMLEVSDAIDRLTIGLTLSPLLDSKGKRLIAYHEAGHALTGVLNKHHARSIDKATILPRSGGIGGFVKFVPEPDDYLPSYSRLLADIVLALGGRAAEEVIFGRDEVTTGASSDIQNATRIAREMVTRYAMSKMGSFALESENSQPFLGQSNLMGKGHEYSDNVATKIDDEVRNIVQEGLTQATEIIRSHRPLIDRLVDRLVEIETMDGEEFHNIVSEYTQVSKQHRNIQDKTMAVSQEK